MKKNDILAMKVKMEKYKNTTINCEWHLNNKMLFRVKEAIMCGVSLYFKIGLIGVPLNNEFYIEIR